MAQYKVPQDVEADDKLIGPFSFRQFVYLLIAGGLVGLAVLLFQIFPALVIIPVPFVLFFLALALPLKKDQPMETYLAAIVSYYLKPRRRFWTPGQRESTIVVTAPKIVEAPRTRNITGEEATHRLSFLADIVDSEGYAIKGMQGGIMRDDLVAEANATPDMFESYQSQVINRVIDQDKASRHEDAIREMREAISRNDAFSSLHDNNPATNPTLVGASGRLPGGTPEIRKKSDEVSREENKRENQEKSEKTSATHVNPGIIELANNPDFTVATIAKEANRLNRKEEGEVFIALH